MLPIKRLRSSIIAALKVCYQLEVAPQRVQLVPTAKGHQGSHTLLTHSLASSLKQAPEKMGMQLGKWLLENHDFIANYVVVGGFLNFSLSDEVWWRSLGKIADSISLQPTGKTVLIEIFCPNSNKPLHLGHLRNAFIGDAVANILEAVGHHVIRVGHINDRGIHICQSMAAYQAFGKEQLPSQVGKKGDHFVGDYYVRFHQVYHDQVVALTNQLGDPEAARRVAPLWKTAQALLRRWEAGDKKVMALWKKMNGWVLAGFQTTLKALSIQLDQVYLESTTYLLGKEVVKKGLLAGTFYQSQDQTIWVDLQEVQLGRKALLRDNGTSLYITQDLGTADLRFKEHAFDKAIYVVGNEQIHHFKVLFAILHKLKRDYASKLYHLAYGMVDLPEGKMKSREGKVVEADQLIDTMRKLVAQQTSKLGKVADHSPEALSKLHEILALGALKYYFLKVKAATRMRFNPEAAIALQGNTAPFIQYVHARIQTLLQKTEKEATIFAPQGKAPLEAVEIELIEQLLAGGTILREAAQKQDPSLVANHLYQLAKVFNRFYNLLPILQAATPVLRFRRVYLCWRTAKALRDFGKLLGIVMPDKM